MTSSHPLTIALLTVALVSGCGAADDRRERQVAETAAATAVGWADPAVQERWASSVVAEDPLLHAPLDPAASAVLTRISWGQLVLDPTVSDRPAPGVVTNHSGSTQPVTTLGAASTLRAVERRGGSCGTDLSCDDVHVTAAEPTTVTLPTGRGPAAVPAWAFTVDGLDAPLVLPSLAEVTSPEDAAPGPAGHSTAPVLAREGTTVRVGLLAGACVNHYRPHVIETDAVIVVWATARQSGGDCLDAMVERAETFTLKAPVGDRPVVDASGDLMLPRSDP